MPYYLGIDQGGTKTQAVVADASGRLLGAGISGGACYTFSGMEKATQMVYEATAQALQCAGIAMGDIAGLAGGIAGIDYPYEVPLLSDAIRARLGLEGRPCNFQNDCIGALWGGVFAPPAAVICSGTGVNAGAVNEKGETYILGNFCDAKYMGASTIGLAALRTIYDHHIGLGPQTKLTGIILDFFGFSDVGEMQIKQFRKKDFATKILCPLVFEAAGQGDEVAISLLRQTAKGYAAYILASARMAGIQNQPNLAVVTSGGVFKGRPAILQQTIAEELSDQLPGARFVEARYEPVVGAAIMALYYCRGGCDPDAIEKSANQLGLIRPEFAGVSA